MMPLPDAFPISNAEAPHYFGEFFHGLDEKNRVSLPAPWRKASRGKDPDPWILVPSPVTICILGFSLREFESELQRIVSLRDADRSVLTPSDVQVFSRQFNAKARQCVPDRQGRLLIPAEMLAVGGYGRELAMVGNRRRIELWPASEWKQRAATDEATYARVASLAGL